MRNRHKKRSITTEHKNRPSTESINETMATGQKKVNSVIQEVDGILGPTELSSTFQITDSTRCKIDNSDETRYTYCIGPKHMFITSDQRRARPGNASAKEGITVDFDIDSGGSFNSDYLILRHSKSSKVKPDQRSMTVVKKLHREIGYRCVDGWELKVWHKQLPTGPLDTMQDHYVNYLVHVGNQENNIVPLGHVITSQYKAWNDTIRNIMHNELIRKPLGLKYGHIVTWEDNCTSHCSAIMNEVMNSFGKDNSRY